MLFHSNFLANLLRAVLPSLAVALLVSGSNAADERAGGKNSQVLNDSQDSKTDDQSESKMAVATFGGGCFWCTEAVFQRVKGVQQVTSGFMGGHVANPTYQMVLTKKTGHAEVIHITYDPSVVKYEKLLEIFWKTHDPTTLNRQGVDSGPQYRSVVFYHTQEQKELATKYKKLLDESKAFPKPIVTEITEADTFYPAEDYHQNYYNLNKNNNKYCNQIKLKLSKFRKVFPDELDTTKDVVK